MHKRIERLDCEPLHGDGGFSLELNRRTWTSPRIGRMDAFHCSPFHRVLVHDVCILLGSRSATTQRRPASQPYLSHRLLAHRAPPVRAKITAATIPASPVRTMRWPTSWPRRSRLSKE
jgi:hypothetical protein